MESMKRATLELNLSAKKTCKREFLEQMERVVSWGRLRTQNLKHDKPVEWVLRSCWNPVYA